MSSITLQQAENVHHWNVLAPTERTPYDTVDDSGNPGKDWPFDVSKENPTSEKAIFLISGESNQPSEIDAAWATLARAAQQRWLRENPF